VGQANWMHGVMGLANLQRSLDIIQTLLEFIIQPEWKDVVPMFGILNEPRVTEVTHDNLASL
jgi:glucan 1,3-beta-glucosidase